MITEITLKNFKAFAEGEALALSRVNLLTGMNGRGKSTLIQSLLLIAQSFDTDKGISSLRLNGKYVSIGSFDDAIRRTNNNRVFSFAFKTDDETDNVVVCSFVRDKDNPSLAQLDELQVNGKSLMETITKSVFMTTKDGRQFVTRDGKKFVVDTQEKVVGSTSDVLGLRQFINVCFISADRKGAVNSIKNDSPWRMQDGVGIHGEYVMNMLDAASDAQREEVNSWLARILSGGYVRTQKDMSTGEIAMFLDPAGGEKGFKPSNVGFGYSYILSVIVAVVMTHEGGKIFIENPEAHLHPGAQARLTSFIIEMAYRKNLQVFVESHSDHVLHTCQIAVKRGIVPKGDMTILFFSFDESEPNKALVEELQVTDEGHVKRPPYGFFDQAEGDLGELIGL